MIIVKYKTSKKPDKEMIKSCDSGAKGFQKVFIRTAELTMPKLKWLVWLLTRFYYRKVTDRSISYHFYLFPTKK